jgi:methionyl aminopeptidase
MTFRQKSPKDIRAMRRAGQLVAQTFDMLEAHIQPGVTLRELDRITEEYIRAHGATPLYKGYRGGDPKHPPFPGTICASLNDEVCHGIPNGRILKEGDIIGVDIGLKLDGFCGDACVTYPVGAVSADAARLLEAAQQCLAAGIAAAKPHGWLNEIGNAIHDCADRHGVSVVREWGGHGIGANLHEPPSVSHYRQGSRGARLRPGMVFTIEPMINLGTHEWKLLPDQWTVKTADGKLSAQFEHTIAIQKDGIEILTLP